MFSISLYPCGADLTRRPLAPGGGLRPFLLHLYSIRHVISLASAAHGTRAAQSPARLGAINRPASPGTGVPGLAARKHAQQDRPKRMLGGLALRHFLRGRLYCSPLGRA